MFVRAESETTATVLFAVHEIAKTKTRIICTRDRRKELKLYQGLTKLQGLQSVDALLLPTTKEKLKQERKRTNLSTIIHILASQLVSNYFADLRRYYSQCLYSILQYQQPTLASYSFSQLLSHSLTLAKLLWEDTCSPVAALRDFHKQVSLVGARTTPSGGCSA